ncbi:short-chain dehydrogenase [Bosea sp. Root381]|uniref:SDR family NAD(P)-dependent oxidoreductase n=1 Tax=Bosea sp. Root381 TaxID=1736524 RepID=UPI0006FC6226|nr:SDR family NAD(P)-dependent oxidoreductase [Bosea sp. Root381]KRE05007.1 short-chain dehydrogenase [Bosea sp. Root381]
MRHAAVIFGASGGIGGALVEAVAASGAYSSVHAVSRSPRAAPRGVTVHRADLTDEESIARVAAMVEATGHVGMLIVASGVLHEGDITPEKSLKAIDPAALAQLFAVNAVGPALVAKHFMGLLPLSGRSTFAAISARVGSIEDNRLGGWYGYRASKAALNQLIRTFAIELKRSRPEAVALALHPGTVATELSKPFRSHGAAGTFSPSEAASDLLAVIGKASADQSGQLLAWDGSRIPF